MELHAQAEELEQGLHSEKQNTVSYENYTSGKEKGNMDSSQRQCWDGKIK